MLPLRHPLRRAGLVGAALLACVPPAAGQDLGLVEGIFQEVSAVTVYYQTGEVPGSAEVSCGALTGLFVEGGYRSRDFHAVRWESRASEELPLAWPRSLDFSGPLLSVGWQVQLGTGDAADGEG